MDNNSRDIECKLNCNKSLDSSLQEGNSFHNWLRDTDGKDGMIITYNNETWVYLHKSHDEDNGRTILQSHHGAWYGQSEGRGQVMLNEILTEAMRINKIKTLDAFFNYSGHVGALTVSVFKDCKYVKDETRKAILSEYIYLDNAEGLESLLKQLKGIQR